jgi:hypothetical protein
VTGGFLALLILLAVAFYADNDGVWGVAVGAAIGLGIFTLGGLMALVFPGEDAPAERTIADRLKTEYFKSSAVGGT